MNKKLLIPIILVVLIGVAAALYFLVLAPDGDKEEPAPVLATYNAGDNYITNVKWDNDVDKNPSKRLFKAGVYLMVDEGMMTDLSDKTSPTIPVIRDTILFIFRDLTEEEIAAPGGEAAIKQRIIDTINERLELNDLDEKGKRKPKVYDVMFTDFVMQ